MPPKRRSAASAPKTAQQSTLAFHGQSNKVTKAGARTSSSGKKNLLSTPSISSEKSDVATVRSDDVAIAPVGKGRGVGAEKGAPTTAEAAIIEQTEHTQQETQSAPEEVEARRLSNEQIRRWWNKASKSEAPRAHQGQLSVEERILRRFDLSGEFGPCVGVARLKRWQRANRLGLEPPIEVLAVLLREQDAKDKLAVQRSIVDEILNSRAEIEV